MEIDIIDELKRIFQIKSDYALAKSLEIDKRQIYRWRKNGFSSSTEKILVKMVNVINNQQNNKKSSRQLVPSVLISNHTRQKAVTDRTESGDIRGRTR